MTRVAFHAPMKPPDHPTPSGDRRIARLMLQALERAGFAPFVASRLRTRDGAGCAGTQAAMRQAADREAERLAESLAADPPALWFTYHCYWKAPDLVGPRVASALRIPYVVAEGTRAPKRLKGPWAGFAAEAEAALDRAAAVFWLTRRDLPALEAARPAGQRLVELPPFVALDAPAARPASLEGPLRLATVAMMREGDKLASYRALAAGLAAAADVDWRLTIAGDGPAEPDVRALLAPFGDRAAFAGRQDADGVRALFWGADLLAWPGVNEGVGMVYLEAQAAGRAVVAEDRPGVRDVVAPGGALVPPGDPAAFAAALRRFDRDRPALAAAGRAARARMEARHGLDAAAATLRGALEALL